VSGLKRYNQLPFSAMERYGRTLLSSPVSVTCRAVATVA
jgi:hypothetical protein